MNEYQKRLKQLEKDKCKECSGLGECDDSDFGDISFNKWKCKKCNGSGITKTKTETKT